VAKLTASPIFRPVEKPAWYDPGKVIIISPGLYKVLQILTPYVFKKEGEIIVMTSSKILGSFLNKSEHFSLTALSNFSL